MGFFEPTTATDGSSVIGLYIGIPGLTFETTSGMYPGGAYGALVAMLGGTLLLLISTLTGFAALLVRQ